MNEPLAQSDSSSARSVWLGRCWIIAAAFTWMPLVGALLRALAAGATFIAVTAGFGAVLRSYWRGDFSKRAASA